METGRRTAQRFKDENVNLVQSQFTILLTKIFLILVYLYITLIYTKKMKMFLTDYTLTISKSILII
jgi:hypothetical protein